VGARAGTCEAAPAGISKLPRTAAGHAAERNNSVIVATVAAIRGDLWSEAAILIAGGPDSLNTGKRTGYFANFWPFLTILAKLTTISRSNSRALDAIACSVAK
jgi:hypothetical protein